MRKVRRTNHSQRLSPPPPPATLSRTPLGAAKQGIQRLTRSLSDKLVWPKPSAAESAKFEVSQPLPPRAQSALSQPLSSGYMPRFEDQGWRVQRVNQADPGAVPWLATSSEISSRQRQELCDRRQRLQAWMNEIRHEHCKIAEQRVLLDQLRAAAGRWASTAGQAGAASTAFTAHSDRSAGVEQRWVDQVTQSVELEQYPFHVVPASSVVDDYPCELSERGSLETPCVPRPDSPLLPEYLRPWQQQVPVAEVTEQVACSLPDANQASCSSASSVNSYTSAVSHALSKVDQRARELDAQQEEYRQRLADCEAQLRGDVQGRRFLARASSTNHPAPPKRLGRRRLSR